MRPGRALVVAFLALSFSGCLKQGPHVESTDAPSAPTSAFRGTIQLAAPTLPNPDLVDFVGVDCVSVHGGADTFVESGNITLVWQAANAIPEVVVLRTTVSYSVGSGSSPDSLQWTSNARSPFSLLWSGPFVDQPYYVAVIAQQAMAPSTDVAAHVGIEYHGAALAVTKTTCGGS